MWLIAQRRFWTADRLQKRGMDHPASCPLCDPEQEPPDHLLIGCVFARDFWFKLQTEVNLQSMASQLVDASFIGCWRWLDTQIHGVAGEAVNSLIILGAWTLWKHQNSCVFDKNRPNVDLAVRMADQERERWELARARKLSLLTSHIP
jgi:hypothetical protein